MRFRRLYILVFSLVIISFVTNEMVATDLQPGQSQLRQNDKGKLRGLVDYKVITDIDYGLEARNVLDLYIPEGVVSFPSIMWIHGGALRRGDKQEAMNINVCEFFASNGYGVAAINYRLSPKAKFPLFNQDVAAAFSWLHQNINVYKGDSNKLFIMGASAGGYLAASVALDSSWLATHGLGPANIAAAVLTSGMFDLHFLKRTNRLSRQFGTGDEIIRKASPVTYAGKHAPPLLLLYADDDLPGRQETSLNLIEKLEKCGHKDYKVYKIPDRTHRSLGTRFGDTDDPAAKLILDFLNAY